MEERSLQIIILLIAAIVLITTTTLVFVLFVRSQRRNSSVVKEEEDVQGAHAHYACPKCGQSMEKGFAVAGRGIIYHAEDGKAISPFMTILSVLENTMSFSMKPAENRAWHCASCKYLLLDHSTLIRRKKA